MFARSHRLEADERDLHTGQGTDRVPRGVRDVQTAAETTHEDQGQSMKRDHVRNKRITACKRTCEDVYHYGSLKE